MFYQILSASLLIQYAAEQRFLMTTAVRDGFGTIISISIINGYITLVFLDEINIDKLRDAFNYKYRRIADRAGEYLRTANRDVWMCDLEFYSKSISILT